MKKVLSCLLVLVIILSFSLLANAESENVVRGVNFELPNAKIEVSGNVKMSDIEDVKLEDSSLKVKETSRYSKSSSSDLVYVLIDTSTSVRQSDLDALKPSLIDFANTFAKDDKFVLYTFGVEIKKVLSGNESMGERAEKISEIRCNEAGTTFYQALNKVYENAKSQDGFDRKYVITISDGVNYDKGSASQQEVYNNYSNHTLPLYAMCAKNATEDNANDFGYLARESGGELVMFDAYSAQEQFYVLEQQINDITIVDLSSDIKKSKGKAELSLEISGQKVETTVLANAKKDTIKPIVESIVCEKENNAFVVTFSEQVEGATEASAYKIFDEYDNEYSIVEAKYTNSKKDQVKLKINEKIYSAEYTFAFLGITDVSDDQNVLSDNEYTTYIESTAIAIKYLIISLYVIIPLLFLLAIYLILVMAKHKKRVTKITEIFQQQVEEQEIQRVVQVPQKQGIKASFYIETKDCATQKVDFNIVSSIIVGRSNMCELIIDDPKLSRQHFSIESTGNGLAVCDLQTTNGTKVNGIPVLSKTFIKSHDKIEAGLSVITIEY